jgi:hypothetical protein
MAALAQEANQRSAERAGGAADQDSHLTRPLRFMHDVDRIPPQRLVFKNDPASEI